MAVTQKDVEHVATLARLGVYEDDKDKKEYTKNFVNTLDFVKKLQEVDTADVPETYQVSGLVNVTRPDEVKPSMDREAFLRGAPATQANQLKVRAIFNG